MDRITKLLVGIGSIIVLVLVALLIILDKDPTSYVGSLAAIVTTLASVGIVGKRLDTVAKNVNGNTTKLIEDNRQLRELAGIGTGTVSTQRSDDEYSPELMSEDTLTRIEADADKLPKHKR